MSDPTCEQRIESQLAGRLEDFTRITAAVAAADDETRDEAEAEAYEYPLDVSVERVVVVLLGTGGPHDEFRVAVDDDGTPTTIHYVFKDWWDGAERRLEGDDYDRARAFLEPFVEIALTT
jgi:hypothetical protein